MKAYILQETLKRRGKTENEESITTPLRYIQQDRVGRLGSCGRILNEKGTKSHIYLPTDTGWNHQSRAYTHIRTFSIADQATQESKQSQQSLLNMDLRAVCFGSVRQGESSQACFPPTTRQNIKKKLLKDNKFGPVMVAHAQKL